MSSPIIDYINKRWSFKTTDHSASNNIIRSTLSDDYVLSSIHRFLQDLDVNTKKSGSMFVSDISATTITCCSEPTIQPIYGFKELQVPTELSVSSSVTKATYVVNLSSIYTQLVKSSDTTVVLSSFEGQLNSMKNQFLEIDHSTYERFSLNNGIMRSSDIIAMLNQLMEDLTNIRKFKGNLYFKRTRFKGGMTMYTCYCSLQDNEVYLDPGQPSTGSSVASAIAQTINGNYQAAIDVLKSHLISPRFPYSFRLYVSPYSKQLVVNPAFESTIQDCSNSAIPIVNRSFNSDDGSYDSADNLVYVKEGIGSEPTFDMSSITGSNGVSQMYTRVTEQKFDLRQHIDVQKMFGIKAGAQISAERIMSAITTIFEIWLKNIKAIQYDIYTCHYNCHANSMGNVPEATHSYDTYKITYDYSSFEAEEGIFEYTKPENIEEYYLGESTISLDLEMPHITKNTLSNEEQDTARIYIKAKFDNGNTWTSAEYKIKEFPFTLTIPDISKNGGSTRYGNLTIQYIKKDFPPMDITKAWTIKTIDTQEYTGDEIKPTIKVKTIYGTTVSSSKYSVRYEDNINPGRATVTVTGESTEKYKGTISTTFLIVNSGRTIAAAKAEGITDKTYTGSAIEQDFTLTYGSTTLTKGTDYTVSYSNNTNVGTANINIKGKNSYSGTKTETFKITALDINSDSITVEPIDPQLYTGSEIKPDLTITHNDKTLTKGTDYTVSYSNNTNVGTATATIKGQGNYRNSQQTTFTIYNPELKNVTVDLNGQWEEYADGKPDGQEGSSYRSFSNKGMPNSKAVMTVSVENYIGEFTLYIRSYAETYKDYTAAYQLDKDITDMSTKAHTQFYQKEGHALDDFRKVTYQLDGRKHTIKIAYIKDGVIDLNDDRGYLFIPII